jgi:nucleotide-binding universal stress UspA family protein
VAARVTDSDTPSPPFATSVVVATDLSDSSCAALEEAARIARACGCPVTLAHVFELPTWLAYDASPRGESLRRRIAEEASGAAQSVLLGMRERHFAGLAKVSIRTLEHESVAQGIAHLVAEVGADLVLLSSRGRSGASGVTEKLVRLSPCRVLVVPPASLATFAH